MLGAARAAARAIRHALGANDLYAAHTAFTAYQGPSRLPLTALVHGTIRTRMPMAAAIAVESHLESSKTLRTPTLEAYISALSSSEPQVIPTTTSHTPTTAALTILAAARRSRQQQRTTHMYDAAIRACLIQGEILTGSLLFVLLVRDWKNRHRPQSAEPTEPVPDFQPTPTTPSPLEKWNRSFPTAFTSPIPSDAPSPPFPAPHLLEAIVAALDLRPRPHPQATHDLPPGRPPDSILALAHLARLFTEGALPFPRHAALLNALARVPPTADKSNFYFHAVLRQTCRNPPLLDTRSYNVLVNYSLGVLKKPELAERLVDHMSIVRNPPLRITDATRAIIIRGEAKVGQPGLAARILSHIDTKGHSTKLSTSVDTPTTPPPTPVHAIDIEDLPTDPYLLAAHMHSLALIGNPSDIIPILSILLPDYHLPHDPLRVRRTAWRAIALGPTVLTSILNALCKCGRTGLAERVHRLGVLAERLSPDFHLPLAFHTMMLQLYAREARKGLVVIFPKPSPLAPPHEAKAIVDVGTLLTSMPKEHRSDVLGWGWDVPTPGGRTIRGMRRWALARSAVAHVYLTYIRPSLPLAQPPDAPEPTKQYIPDARLFNVLLDTFGRRPNMFLHTYISAVERRRERLAARHGYSGLGTGVPQRVDAFMSVLVRDMAEVGIDDLVPGAWKHLLPPSSPALRSGPCDTPTTLRHPTRRAERQQIIVPPMPGASRWRPRNIRVRGRLGQSGRRSEAWRRAASSRRPVLQNTQREQAGAEPKATSKKLARQKERRKRIAAIIAKRRERQLQRSGEKVNKTRGRGWKEQARRKEQMTQQQQGPGRAAGKGSKGKRQSTDKIRAKQRRPVGNGSAEKQPKVTASRS